MIGCLRLGSGGGDSYCGKVLRNLKFPVTLPWNLEISITGTGKSHSLAKVGFSDRSGRSPKTGHPVAPAFHREFLVGNGNKIHVLAIKCELATVYGHFHSVHNVPVTESHTIDSCS